jgi:hypothetical protein
VDRMAQVPPSWLYDPDVTASAKVVYMALCVQPAATRAELAFQTGLCPRTVRTGLAQASSFRLTAEASAPEEFVQVPGALLADRTVRAQAKVLFGLLQATPGFHGQSGHFTYASLAALTQLSPNTLKNAVAELAATGWVELVQPKRVGPIHFKLGRAEWRRGQAEATAARRRLKRARFGGEALMQEYLSLLISSDQFADNARPGWLVNPQTGERLELDRYYPPSVAFEFNGAQHYSATGRFSQEEAETQHLRDLIKAGICLYRGVDLVIVHAADLSLQGMLHKIGSRMPLRHLAAKEPLISLLEEASLVYQAAAASGLNRYPL